MARNKTLVFLAKVRRGQTREQRLKWVESLAAKLKAAERKPSRILFFENGAGV